MMEVQVTTNEMSYTEKASRMPLGVRQKVKQASDRVNGKLHPATSDIEYLFDIFHEYITHYPKKEKIECNDCRIMVRSFWEHEVVKWKQ